jgi:hypothetical protein
VRPSFVQFRLAAYILGATAVVELLRAVARVRGAPDLPRTPDLAWGLVAAVVAIAAGYGAHRRRGWAPAAFAAAAVAYLGRAVSVGAQVWQRFPSGVPSLSCRSGPASSSRRRAVAGVGCRAGRRA